MLLILRRRKLVILTYLGFEIGIKKRENDSNRESKRKTEKNAPKANSGRALKL